jgi:hypothetical protein
MGDLHSFWWKDDRIPSTDHAPFSVWLLAPPWPRCNRHEEHHQRWSVKKDL